jgi:hypothetical protein
MHSVLRCGDVALPNGGQRRKSKGRGVSQPQKSEFKTLNPRFFAYSIASVLATLSSCKLVFSCT